ncbi:hypothetical protein [Mucilaginibacter celer]|uniref:Uncharacterized protein n=1 Tax=Mucilaginibacter celer TaxID=2305508 RepID=A0A494VLK0_9SPHI|nr:hypothetical protein [Mucilaginibacter celer]AYL96146.1 hypothetical protein HYN43_012970 [Mucilaginibacter celer]
MNWKNTEKAIYAAVNNQAQQFALKDTAEYPLAFNVDMPTSYAFNNGNLSFKFTDFVCSDLRDVQLISDACVKTGDQVSIRLMLDKITLKGRYTINAKMAHKITMDTAGNMLDFEDERDLLQAAGADSGRKDTLSADEQRAFAANAQDQEKRLMDTPAGRELMKTYREHNEIYNEVFNTNPAARRSWYANGATAAMARDTDFALKTEGVVVNSPTKTYGVKNTSYNANAILQQLNIFSNTLIADPDFDITDPDSKPDPDSKYYKAAAAALSFGKAVDLNTHNNDKNINPLTANQVYDHVNNSNAMLPPVTVEEVMNVFSQANGKGGADEAEGKGWIVLDEEQRKLVRMWQTEAIQRKAFDPNMAATVLWEGECGAEIINTTVDVELSINEAAQQITIDKTSVSLPTFEFDIDDSSWTGKAAEVIRERVSQLYFIKSLISRQIEQGIQTVINQSVLTALQAS